MSKVIIQPRDILMPSEHIYLCVCSKVNLLKAVMRIFFQIHLGSLAIHLSKIGQSHLFFKYFSYFIDRVVLLGKTNYKVLICIERYVNSVNVLNHNFHSESKILLFVHLCRTSEITITSFPLNLFSYLLIR